MNDETIDSTATPDIQQDEQQQPEATEVEAQEAEQSEQPTAEDTAEKEPKENKVQKRINELTREKYEARKLAEEAEARAAELQKKLEAQNQAEQEKAPDELDYDDHDEYLAARDQYLINQAKKAALQEFRAEERTIAQQLKEQERAAKAQEKFVNNLQSKADQFENFDQVAGGHPYMSNDMYEIILESDKGPELAYHLGSHLDEAERIYSLPPIMQARELTKLEAKIETANPKKATSAPDPIVPIGSGGTVEKDPEQMSGDEWAAWRYKQLEKKRNTS